VLAVVVEVTSTLVLLRLAGTVVVAMAGLKVLLESRRTAR